MVGGSAAEATREELPCSRSDLKVINQTLRGEEQGINLVRGGPGKRRNAQRTIASVMFVIFASECLW